MLGERHTFLQGKRLPFTVARMELKDRLKQARKAAGLTQVELAERAGIKQASVSEIERGLSRTSGYLVKIAQICGVDPAWLAEGVGTPASGGTEVAVAETKPKSSSADLVLQMLAKHGKGLSEDAKAKITAATKVSAAVTVDHDEVEVDFYRPGQNGDEVWIAHYDVRGAMGGGQIPDDYPEMLQDVRVSPQHLRSMGVEFKEHFHLKVVTGWGQSMAPTIKHRDPLLVNVSIREFVGDGIYLFSWGGHLYIKRLQMKGADHFKMISDNKHHDPEEIRVDETYIQARVLLVWNANLV